MYINASLIGLSFAVGRMVNYDNKYPVALITRQILVAVASTALKGK